MKVKHVITAGIVAGAGIVTTGVLGWSMGLASSAPASTPRPAQAIPHYVLSIDTPDMLAGNPTGPAYVPANVDWPANTTIEVTIYNFDDATALPAGSAQYAKATGIIGSLSVASLDAGNPNEASKAREVSSLDPENGVSHTFTVQALGLNVPVAPQSVTTFRFHTGLAGTYEWHCMDPCGSGPVGWGGAMAARGYMAGTVHLI